MSSFFLFRLPEENTFYYTQKSNHKKNLAQFVSFDLLQEIAFENTDFQTKTIQEILKLETEINLNFKDCNANLSEENYLKLIEKTIENIKKNNWEKVVISTIIEAERNPNSVTEMFLKLCEKFPSAFCYLAYFQDNTCWIGATPELLFTVENNNLQTMALAGTLANNEEQNWTEKEIDEHNSVKNYITEKLKPLAKSIEIDETETLQLNQLKHLKTNIKATLKEEINAIKLAKVLHPTPAVCGNPLKETKDFILENETHKREFYTGYILLNFPKKTYAFVNLRCAKIYKNCAQIFVGGGITKNSIPEKEYAEILLKSQTIKNLL